ncbi:MAG: hypothetical protein R6U98_18920 [Pirellulaceae bacterium]
MRRAAFHPEESNRLKYISSCLPEVDIETHRFILTQLIKIDLEQRWNAGERVQIESYLEYWRDLQCHTDLVAELLSAECRVRSDHGVATSREELGRRFPGFDG